MQFDAVLFDCDGVLVDSETIATQALHRSLQDIGLDFTVEHVFATFTGQSFAHCVAIIEDYMGRPIPSEFVPNNRTYFRELLEKELVPMPGIKDVLSSLQTPYAVVTNSRKRELDLKLTRTGINEFFPMERRFDTETVGVAKPDPEIYKRAAAAMNVDITRCLILEDSFPGMAAGAGSGATLWGYCPHLTQEQLDEFGVTQVVSDWAEFAELFHQANTGNPKRNS
jgi:HAD superfamily hydrolase (TIGR01509 family)